MASNSSKRWKFWKKQPDKSKKEAPLNNHESLLERVDEQKKIIIALKDECRRLEVTRRELDSYKNKCHNMEAKMSLQVKKLESDRLRLQESLRKTEVENKMLILALEKIKKNDNNNNINKNNNNNHSNNNSNNNNINRSIKNNDFNGSFNVMNNFNNNMNTEHSNNNSSYKEETRIINKNSDSNNNGNNDKNNNSDNNNNFSNKSNNRNNKKHDTQSMTKNNTKTDNTTNSNNTHNTTQANKQEDKDTKSTELNDNNKYEVYIAQIEELRNTVTRLEKENVFLHSLFQECLNGNARGLQRCMFASSPPPVYNHEHHQTSHLHKNNNKSNNHENNNNDHNNNINNNATLFNDKNQAIVVNGYEHNCHSSCGSSGSDSLSGLDNDGDKMNSNKDFENNPSDKHNEKPNEKGFNNREESINATTQEVTNDKDSKTSRDSRRRSSLSLNDFLDGEVLSETEKLLNIDQDDVCEPTDPFNDVTSGFYSFESDPKLHSVNHSFSSKSTFLVSAGSLKAGSSGEEERTLKRNKKDESFSGNCSNEVNHNGLEENKCSNSFLIDDKNDEKDYDGNETFNWEESSLSSVECSSLFVESCSERDDERKDSGSYDGVYDDDSVDDVFDDVMTAGNEIASRNNEVSALDGNTFNKNEKIDGVSNMKNNEFPSKTINQIDENNMDNGCENFLKNKKTRLNSKHSAESSEEDNIFMESLEDYFKKYRCIDDTFLLNKKRNSTKRNSLDDSTINNFSPCIYVPKRSFDETTLRIDLKAFCSKMLGNDMDRMRKMINLVKTNQGHAVLSDNVNSVVISKDKVSALKKYFEEKNSFDINKIKNKKKETKEMNNKSKKNLSCDSVKKEDGSDKANKPFKAPSIVKKTSDNFKPVQNKASDDVTIYKREENKTEGQTRAYLKSKTISPKSCHAPKLSSNVSNVSNSPKISVVSKSSEVSPKPQSVTQKSNINQKYLKNSVKNNDISCKASNINQSKKDKKVSQQTKKPLVSTPKQKRSSLSKQVKTTNTTNPPLVKLSLQNNVNKIFTKSPLPPRKLTKTTQPLHNITKANSSATKQSKDVKNSPLLKVTSRDFRASSVPSPLMPIKRNKPPSFRIAVAKTTSLKSFALQPPELKDMKSCRRKSPIRENIVANNTSKVDAFTASSSILHDIEKYKLHQMKSKNDFYSMLKENSNPFEDSFSKVSDFNRCNPNDKVSNKSSSSSMSYWDSDSKSEQASPKTFKMDNKFSNYRIASHKKNRNEANCISNISPSFVPSSQKNSKLCKPTNKKTQENSSNVNKNKIKTNDIKSKNDSSIETFNKYFNNMRSGLVDKPPNSINQKKPGNYTVSPKALKTTNNKTTGSNALKKNGAVTCGCRIKMSKEPPRVPRQKVSSVKTNGSVMNKSTSSSIRNSSSSLSSEPVSHMSLQNSYLLNDSFERTTDDMGKRADVCVGGPLMTQCSESAIMMRLKQCDAYDRNSFHDYKQDAQKPLQHETFDNSNHISKHNPQVYKQNQPKNQLADIKEKSNKTEKQKLPIFSSVGWMRKKPKTTSQTPNKSFQKPFFNLTKLQQPLNQPTLQTSNISSKSYPINTRSSLASYSTSPYSRLPLSVFKTKRKEVNT